MKAIAAIAGVLAATVALAAAATAPPAGLTAPVSVAVSDNLIRITPRYEGELVKVSGTAPIDCDVVVKLTSERQTVYCSRKGKVGAFWLSVGRVKFSGVPRMYKVKSAVPIEDIVSAADQVKYVLGPRGLKASMAVETGADRGLYLDELILIRERDRLFSFRDGAVKRQGESFTTTFYWPPDGPPGRYRIEAYALRGGHVAGMDSVWVEVRAVGVEAWVRDLAIRHGFLYGIFAVGLAAVAGLAASLGFKRRPRRRPAHGRAF